MEDIKEKLRRVNSSIAASDRELAGELKEVRNNPGLERLNDTRSKIGLNGGLEGLDDGFALETIVLKTGRPVLQILNNDFTIDFTDVESEVWRNRLKESKQQLLSAIPSVGRIELNNDPTYDWVGTGWLVDQDLIVTNRHVAEVFARSNGSQFVFKQGIGGKEVESFVDFLEEANNPKEFTFKLEEILHIEDWPGPDIALVRVTSADDKNLPKPINLADFIPEDKRQVAVIGYPARDSRITEQDLMIKIFGDIYNKKRLAPGQLMRVSENELLHDCSTLGGNSGSVVLDLKSGDALGLHFAGRFLQSNSAVPAAVIKDRVKRFGNRTIRQSVTSTLAGKTNKEISKQAATSGHVNTPQNSIAITIPLHINIALGNPSEGTL